MNSSAPTIALVLPGGGARGAYEIGAVSELLPALEARGERVSLFCGTSVGAINAALLASLSGRPASEQVAEATARWSELGKNEVIRPLVGPGLPLTALRFLGDAIGVPGVRLASVLDPSPLSNNLEHWIDWLALQRLIRRGPLKAVCVVATALGKGRPVGFVDTRGAVPRATPSEDLRYVRVTLEAQHVRASAAIPLLFPPVEVVRPRGARDHYIDGGTRLNTPIKPALTLGADRVIVVGFEPFEGGSTAPAEGGRPGLSDVVSNVVDGLLVDQVGEDLRRLIAINSFFAESAGVGPSPSARAYRRAHGLPPYRRISYALVSPSKRGQIADIAEQVFNRRYGGLRGLLSPDYPLISRVLGGRARSRGELLSFILFDREFVSELMEAGRRDARRWLDRHPGFWCSDPAHDFDGHPQYDTLGQEEDALAEYRQLRR